MGERLDRERQAAQDKPWLWVIFAILGGPNLWNGLTRLPDWTGIVLALGGIVMLGLAGWTLYLSKSPSA